MKHYILFRGLLPSVAEKCGWTNYTKRPHRIPRNWRKLQYQHPFCNRIGKLFAADLCDELTRERALCISRRGMVWTTIISDLKSACRFIRRWMMTASWRTRTICRTEQQMPERHDRQIDRWKSTARATRMKRCCMNCGCAMRCCIRRIIITAIRIAGAARRRLFFARWTSGLSGSTTVDANVSADRRWRKSTRSNWIPDWGVNRIKGAVAIAAGLVHLAAAFLGRAVAGVL